MQVISYFIKEIERLECVAMLYIFRK